MGRFHHQKHFSTCQISTIWSGFQDNNYINETYIFPLCSIYAMLAMFLWQAGSSYIVNKQYTLMIIVAKYMNLLIRWAKSSTYDTILVCPNTLTCLLFKLFYLHLFTLCLSTYANNEKQIIKNTRIKLWMPDFVLGTFICEKNTGL